MSTDPHPDFVVQRDGARVAGRRRSFLGGRRVLESLAALALAVPACLDRPIAPIEPVTGTVLVGQVPQTGVDKLDLLFVVDNSASMKDKQEILRTAVPRLVERLVSPGCVDAGGAAVATPAGADDPCPDGSKREFEPVRDMHIGVISSSLGSYGGDICPETPGENYNDRAHLLTRGTSLTSGFLKWSADGDDGGISDSTQLISNFQSIIAGVGENGCGFEATLESWYRFLIDPAPALSYVNDACGPDGGSTCTYAQGVDEQILAQRAAFLRPDSLLSVVMLTDENDCSLRPTPHSWFSAASGEIRQGGTSACATDPNSECCFSCASASAPAGCTAPKDDAACTNPAEASSAQRNLRCFDMKRRFGIDLMHPVQRYIDGLTQTTITVGGQAVANPLFAGGRAPDSVFLAGIVGVPWGRVATDDSLSDPDALRLKPATELDWTALIGDPATLTPPSDPHMIESVAPRASLPGPDASSGTADPVHGHEHAAPGQAELQFACTFPLLTPKPDGEDCDKPDQSKSPLCRVPDGSGGMVGSFTTTQYRAKAYPGSRHLEVLQGIGEQAVVASICPKIALDTNHPNFGYTPAVDGIIDRLSSKLTSRCLDRPFTPAADGTVQCRVVEARTPDGACSCNTSARTAPHPGMVGPVRQKMETARRCGEGTSVPCEDLCLCEITPTLGDELNECRASLEAQNADGWCYIDPDRTATGDADYAAQSAVVAECPATARRKLRFVGDGEPVKGSVMFFACMERSSGQP